MSANRARAIFIELVANVPPEQWEGRLAELAGEDPELRRKVAGLLAAHQKADSFLEQPAVPSPLPLSPSEGERGRGEGGTVDEAPAPGSPGEPLPEPGGTEQPGLVLAGRYKLLEQIGEGGMGTVWMAQQQEPVRRLVAVKLVKTGMDSKAVLARFEAERQALALMDHPHIAKVLDAGAAPDGRPFFVMELVKGVPITRFCDERKLTPRQRLELFVPVCQAVQHAHHKGIIHRDLKPSNVLVALYDDRPVPKVIDFGVAKATGAQLTEATLHTGFGTVVGTVEYMSPEQASFNQLDVDTRSDIYSLGVLLYELLAGSPPFRRKELEKASLLEMLRVIREQEPSKPSTKLSTAEGLPTLAANRGMEPAKLTRLVRGELDWIVMKALEKDRNRRYETANSFAADVQRYLKDEPVSAGPPSALYRFRKFARRRLAALVMATLGVVAALALAGLAVGLWYNQELQRANQSEVKARAEAEEARREVEAAYEQLEYAQYLHHVGLAYLDWRDANVGRMLQLLQECPAHRRGWEWHYLNRLCHTDLLTLRGPAEVKSVALSPDGRTLASGDVSPHGTVRLWDAATDRLLATLTGHRDAVMGVAFSPDGQRLASAGGDGVKVWDLATHKELRTLQGHKDFVRAVAFSPDGRYVASAGHDAVVRVWDAATGEPRCALQGHEGHVHGVAFSPDGKRLASAGLDKTVRVWDIEPGREVLQFVGHTSQIQAVAFSRDGTRLASASWDRTLRVWDATRADGEILVLRGHTNTVGGVAFSPDGQRLASASADRTARVWDTGTGEQLFVFKGHTGAVRGVAFSPDGQRLASAGGDHTVKIWDVTRSQDARTFRQPDGDIRSLAFSPDGKWLASAGRDRDGGNVLLWDAAAGRVVRRLRGHTSAVWGVTFRPDGQQLAAAGEDGTVRIWDIGPGQADGANPPVRTLAGSRRRIYGVAFVLDGTRLAAAGEDGIVRVWDVTTGEVVCTHQGHRKTVRAVAVSPDGRRVASAGEEHTARVWDAATGQEALLLKGHATVVSALAFSPDGSRLASACWDATVRLWDARTGQEVRTLKGHTNQVHAVAFSPDGKRLASAGWDQTVKVWDVATGQCTLTLTGHNAEIYSVAFSPDGTLLASASTDGVVKVWDATPVRGKAD